ncbi:MAG: hypothetical protein IT353_09830 [Gemmatimonadaceae bacterium]|nr:hypothetical protein [Gemmatimonadaceae bacterium]
MTDGLPSWSVISPKRRDHIVRVVALLDRWSSRMALDDAEQQAWRDAGLWHDALRDADETTLRQLTNDFERPYGLLHGPAAAMRREAEGEERREVLDAIRYHTIGFAGWSAVGRALYMADFLEPGRTFMQVDRAFLADRVPEAFDAVFRQVVRLRLEWAIREGKGLAAETVAMWNAVR